MALVPQIVNGQAKIQECLQLINLQAILLTNRRRG
ncbi:hypothetical protein HPL003_10620 [Paenibacillus terrae HPL-003]|uniref:Uncharacterized protein n=1 Tax=Paenibacillus terrae (strain HPL-003) TaxID=985665 RepID=G7VW84_PAETH|nr:hypothetical protein HPL003_10620 [Paenibacillus terrae HPL-003]